MIYLSTIAVCAILYMDITWTCGLITSTELWQVTFTHSSTTQGSRLLKLKYTLKLSGEIGKQDTQIIYVSTTSQSKRKAGHPNYLCFYHQSKQKESRTPKLFMFLPPVRAIGKQDTQIIYVSTISQGNRKAGHPNYLCFYHPSGQQESRTPKLVMFLPPIRAIGKQDTQLIYVLPPIRAIGKQDTQISYVSITHQGNRTSEIVMPWKGLYLLLILSTIFFLE